MGKAKMKIPVLVLLLTICSGCTQEPKAVMFYPNRIEATVSDRKAWVRDEKKRDRARFDIEYGSVLLAKKIEAKEAMQLGYLFFYSSGQLCGYLDNPRVANGIWQLDFFPGIPSPGSSEPSGDPVFVDSRTGEVWQEGQKRLNALALLRYE